jgi:hypothetical protein
MIREGVGRGLPGLHKTRVVILAVAQGQGEAVRDGTYDSSGARRDSGDARHQAGDWHGWLGSSEALGGGA